MKINFNNGSSFLNESAISSSNFVDLYDLDIDMSIGQHTVNMKGGESCNCSDCTRCNCSGESYCHCSGFKCL